MMESAIKNKKSSGHDGISKILKLISKFILSPLSNLVNRSIETGYVPQIFKIAKVLPLYKSKDQTS